MNFIGFIRPVLWDNNLKDVFHYIHLQSSVTLCGGRQRGGGIDLNEPRLQIVLDQHIVTVHLEAMLVADDRVLNTLQRDVNDVLDLVEALVGIHFSTGLLKPEP